MTAYEKRLQNNNKQDYNRSCFFLPSRQPLSTALKLHTMESNVLIELSPFEIFTKTPWEKTSKCHINNWQANIPVTTLLKKPIKTFGSSKFNGNVPNHCFTFLNVILSLTVLVPTHCMSFLKEVFSLRKKRSFHWITFLIEALSLRKMS